MYVCVCHAITEQAVRDKAQSSCFAFAYYSTELRTSVGCCKCFPRIKEIIDEEKPKYEPVAAAFLPDHVG